MLVPTTDSVSPGTDEALDLGQLFEALLRRWRWVLFASILGGAIAASYAWSVSPRYVAEVVVVPREAAPTSGMLSQLGQLGGLAGLVGIGATSKGRDEAVAILRSRAFARAFIARQKINLILERDSTPLIGFKKRKWTEEDAVEFFVSAIRSVYDDKKTGQVKIAIEWSDPKAAAAWANSMVLQLNEAMRRQALEESGRNIAYLTSELERSNVVALTESISGLLENEFKRMMIARGAADYAFRVIDPAVPPVDKIWPKRLLLTVLGGATGFVLAVVALVVGRIARTTRHLARSVGAA